MFLWQILTPLHYKRTCFMPSIPNDANFRKCKGRKYLFIVLGEVCIRTDCLLCLQHKKKLKEGRDNTH